MKNKSILFPLDQKRDRDISTLKQEHWNLPKKPFESFLLSFRIFVILSFRVSVFLSLRLPFLARPVFSLQLLQQPLPLLQIEDLGMIWFN